MTNDLPPAFGVNVIGDVTIASGLGEAALNIVEAMAQQGIPLSFTPLLYLDSETLSQVNSRFSQLSTTFTTGNPYPVNLLCYNLNELHLLNDDRLRTLTNGKYTIAVWAWELSQLPVYMRPQVNRVDEIWVASRFEQQAIGREARVPVHIVPMPIRVAPSVTVNRTPFGLPNKRFVYFFHFSALSRAARKNPWGVLRAFEQAFGVPGNNAAPDAPLLVMKVHHLDRVPSLAGPLRAALAKVGGVLIEANYDRQQLDDLLSSIDCYVSLHRAEGFGMGIAEAMAVGKPVIATPYSGSVDFMTADNSYPVRYHLRLISEADHRDDPAGALVYEAGQLWAEPDIAHAAELMRYVYTHQAEAQAIGQRAAAAIHQRYSPDAIGQAIMQRLKTLPLSMSES